MRFPFSRPVKGGVPLRILRTESPEAVSEPCNPQACGGYPFVRDQPTPATRFVAESVCKGAGAAHRMHPVEVRCHISCFRCLVRNARCNTMSHLDADAVLCTHLARNARCNTMSHLTAEGCRGGLRRAAAVPFQPARVA